jgi:uncharacterized RDD family membrane protein YckC
MSSFPPPEFPAGSFGSIGPVPVGNGKRFVAYLVDTLLAIVTCFIGWFVWSIVLWQQSTSPAKKMFGLRVVDSTTGAPATMQQMLMRELAGKFGAAVALNLLSPAVGLDNIIGLGNLFFLVSAVMVLASPARQAIWDLIAKTKVVGEN